MSGMTDVGDVGDLVGEVVGIGVCRPEDLWGVVGLVMVEVVLLVALSGGILPDEPRRRQAMICEVFCI